MLGNNRNGSTAWKDSIAASNSVASLNTIIGGGAPGVLCPGVSLYVMMLLLIFTIANALAAGVCTAAGVL